MNKSFLIFIFILYCFVFHSIAASIAPGMMPCPSIKSGTAQVVNLNFTGSSITSSVTFSSPFGSSPRLAYGIKQYRGNDTFYEEAMETILQTLSTTGFSVRIVNISYTRIRLCSYSYIAIDSGFNHHLNAFYDVRIDNGGSWSSMDTFSTSTLTYTSTNDYSALCSSSPGVQFICNFPSLTSAKITIFLSSFQILKEYNAGALKFTLSAAVSDSTHFTLTATTYTRTALKLIRMGVVLYDKNQLQTNDIYPFDGGFNAPSSGYNYAFNQSLKSNLILSLLYWSAPNYDCGLHYSWNFTGTNQINIPAYVLYPGGNASCTQDNTYNSYFYLYQNGCNNPSYPYYYSIDGMCHNVCPSYTTVSGTNCINCALPCLNCNSVTTTFCTACDSTTDHRALSGSSCICITGYVINPADTTGPCLPDCDSSYPSCATCSFTPFQCILCDAGYSLRNDGTCAPCSNFHCSNCNPASTQCFTCDPSSDYFLNGTSLQCQHCSITIPYCQVCSSITVCSSCDTTNDFRVLTSNCQCMTGYAQPTIPGSVCSPCSNFITNCQQCSTDGSVCSKCLTGNSLFLDNTCQPCSVLNCIDCSQIDTTCYQCDTLNGYFLNVTNQCQTCTGNIPYCMNCVDLNTCAGCDANDNRQLDNNACTCIAGAFQPAVPNSLCPLCSTSIPNCELCSSDGLVCTQCQSGYWLLPGNVCQDCSLSNCLSCSQTAQICFNCDTTSQYHLNPNNNLCETCLSNILYCISCSDYQTCDGCDVNDNRQLDNNACTCIAGTFQPAIPNSLCPLCSTSIPNCELCSSDGLVCTQCQSGYWLLPGNVCQDCSLSNCLSCSQTAQICFNCDTTSQYHLNPNNNLCETCLSNILYCISCSDYQTCDGCDNNNHRQLISQQCVCQYGYYEPLVSSSLCSSCPITISNCQQCVKDASNTFIQCQTCMSGYSLRINNVCNQCSNYHCLVCDPTSVECLQCDQSSQYFKNGSTLQCQACTLAHCLTCSSLTTCILCNQTQGYGVNSVGLCQQCSITCGCNGYGFPKINGICTPICGDGLIRLDEQCDDGNILNQDGCNSQCKVEKEWICINEPSCCYLDSINYQFWLQKVSIIKASDQNHMTITINLNPQVPILTKISLSNSIKLNLTSQQIDGNSLSITFDPLRFNLAIDFNYLKTIQNQYVKISFQTLITTDHCQSNPDAQLTIKLKSDNNLPLVAYTPQQYKTKKALQGFWYGMQAASYAVLLGSLLPCKIVGIQLFGVLQLLFFSMSQYQDVNIFMTPLLAMKQLNGYNMFLSQDNQNVPKSISSMNYKANFIDNCNIMIWFLLSQLILGAILYVTTLILKNLSQKIHKIAKHLLKQVLITLILFNILNISFSVALHFIYSSPSSQYYIYGTLFALVSLCLPVGIIIGLFFANAKEFGEFKNKFKSGMVCQSYFVVTIFYRMIIGLYLASKSQSQLTSLILLFFAILFLMYNFINLPYKDAYQNYRANICHISQFVILFVAMFFRSMKSSTEVDIKTRLFSPVVIILACVTITLIVSSLVLCYQIYKFIANCFAKKQKKSISQLSITQHNECRGSVLSFVEIQKKGYQQQPTLIFENA